MTVLTALDQITPAWLTQALRLPQGEVVAVRPQGQITNTATAALLEVTYSPDAPAESPRRLFFKMTRHPAEVNFYQRVASTMPDPPIVRCFEAAYDPATNRSHLLFADVSDTHTEPDALPPTLAYCEALMDSLARFHAHWWEHPRLQIDIGALAEDIPAFLLREAQAHFADFVDFMADRLSAERRALYEKIMAQAPRRPAHALTLAHGDAHFWNLLAPRNPAEGRVLMIDWAVWHLNTGPSDVAYMLAQHWYPERRARFERPLLQRYHAQLLAHGITNYAWEHCWTDYRLSVVSLVLWPIFWWAHQLSPHIWWHNLERGWLAFTDLGCADFLN